MNKLTDQPKPRPNVNLVELLLRAHYKFTHVWRNEPWCQLCECPWDYCAAFGTKDVEDIPYG